MRVWRRPRRPVTDPHQKTTGNGENNMKNTFKAIAVAAGIVTMSTAANAQVNNAREAQRAYQASSQNYQEAAQGWQRAHDVTVVVRDTCRDILVNGLVNSARR